MNKNDQPTLRTPGITVHNRQRAVPVPLAALQEFALLALTECLKIPRTCRTELQSVANLDVNLISDRRMAELHRRFLHQPGSTDVITFHHGEIFISVERARSQASRFGSSMERELRLYIVHGLLHLHQFDDTKPTAAKVMERTQNRVVQAATRPNPA